MPKVFELNAYGWVGSMAIDSKDTRKVSIDFSADFFN